MTGSALRRGHRNLSCSKRLYHNAKPLRSQYKHFSLSRRPLQNTNSAPLKGECAISLSTITDKPFIDLRKSTGSRCTTAGMPEVEQRRSSCRGTPLSPHETSAWVNAADVGSRLPTTSVRHCRGTATGCCFRHATQPAPTIRCDPPSPGQTRTAVSPHPAISQRQASAIVCAVY